MEQRIDCQRDHLGGLLASPSVAQRKQATEAGARPPKWMDKWSLNSLQQRLMKTGGRLVKHARYYWLLLAESHLTRRLFGSMVRRMAALPFPTG